MLFQDMGNGHSFANSCSMMAGTFGKAGCCRHGVSNTSIRFVTRQGYTLAAIARSNLFDLARLDKPRIDPLLLLQLHVNTQSICSLLIRQHNHARRHKSTISTNQVIKVLKDDEAISRHANSEVVGVVLPDN